LEKVQGKSKREVEKVLAELFPIEMALPDIIRRLPIQKIEGVLPEKEAGKKLLFMDPIAQNLTGSGASTLMKKIADHQIYRKETIQLMAPRMVKIEFSASEALAKKIERAKEILRHAYPHGKLEDIINEALEALLEKKDPERRIARMEKAAVGKEEKSAAPKGNQKEERSAGSIQSRYIPQEIRRKVWKRDRGECSYQAPDGKRCAERGALEIDHIHPFALGGDSATQNLQLLCRTHNHYRAQQTFGVFRV